SDVVLNGEGAPQIPGNLNLSFAYVEGEGLMMGIKELSVSSGSACTSASLEPSYVLRALGVDEEMAHTSIRFGLGRFTTVEEVDMAAETGEAPRTRARHRGPPWGKTGGGLCQIGARWRRDWGPGRTAG